MYQPCSLHPPRSHSDYSPLIIFILCHYISFLQPLSSPFSDCFLFSSLVSHLVLIWLLAVSCCHVHCTHQDKQTLISFPLLHLFFFFFGKPTVTSKKKWEKKIKKGKHIMHEIKTDHLQLLRIVTRENSFYQTCWWQY